MPTLLLPNNKIFDNEKSPFISQNDHLEHQLKPDESIEAAYQMAATTEYSHDSQGTCYNCDNTANYHLIALRLSKRKQSIQTNAALLAIVQQAVALIQCHVDNSRATHLPWLPVLMTELRELGKLIKDDSLQTDRYIPLSLPLNVSTHSKQQLVMREDYGRAIRISVYYCRAHICEDMDLDKAISYYRKCLSVHPTLLDAQQQNLQQSAKMALEQLITDQHNTTRPKLPSRTSSVSSGASSSCSMSCSNCGVEKRGMPVCSKCKSQYYCGIRCLKAHKPVHDLECRQY
ncbi:hypothetical protein BD408DRAFT_413247 [Parasitella parasitica]|nr:hypothetical protein BD408DRAFT_413247 [Parasitella parasitica]